jgi:hypothetical protein
LPNGKPSGLRCPHLTDQNLCSLFGKPERPAICSSFQANPDCCGTSQAEAFELIDFMEWFTAPNTN